MPFRFDQQAFEDLGRRELRAGLCGSSHPVECPEQIHRRGPASREVVQDEMQSIIKLFSRLRSNRLAANDDAVGCRDADRWRAADPERFDRFPDNFDGRATELAIFDRQQSLIDQLKMAGLGIANPRDGGTRVGHDLCFFTSSANNRWERKTAIRDAS